MYLLVHGKDHITDVLLEISKSKNSALGVTICTYGFTGSFNDLSKKSYTDFAYLSEHSDVLLADQADDTMRRTSTSRSSRISFIFVSPASYTAKVDYTLVVKPR